MINGGMGADELDGGPSKDRLNGSTGPDVLDGGPGRDRCNGKGSHQDSASNCEKQVKIP
jgi:Ca2+-binding RTX toxin-like protein